MATMVVEVYDALIDAGASDEKSRAAAKAIADLDTRFNRVESDLTLLKWMVGANVGLSLAIIARTFFN
jgi:hypothetical protein